MSSAQYPDAQSGEHAPITKQDSEARKPEEEDQKRQKLARVLKRSALASRYLGRVNYLPAYLLYIVAVLASIVATLSVVFDFRKEIIAILAAVPGAALSVNLTLQFEARAQWHYKRMNAYARLARDLQFGKRTAEDVSQEIAHVETELVKEWPGFRSGTIPPLRQGEADSQHVEK